jgi:membrane protease YdiL (CAAX protease family)
MISLPGSHLWFLNFPKMKQGAVYNSLSITWNKLPFPLRTIFTGFLISSAGIGIWSLFINTLNPPWFILPMIPVLWIYLWFFSGKWKAKNSKTPEQVSFLSTRLSPMVWKLSIAASLLFVVIIQSSFVITFRIAGFPAEKFMADYKILDNMPRWSAWAVLIMSSVVAGICEETGFRGYMQNPLEKKYGAPTAIGITSIIFLIIHSGHSWAIAIIPHIFLASVFLGILAHRSGSIIPGIIGHSILDIFNYSFWWTDLMGGFRIPTIFKTGIDLNFLVWSFIFVISLFAFLRLMTGLKKKGEKRAGSPNEL